MNLDADNTYLGISLISVAVFFILPWALTKLIKSEVDYEKLRHELKDVIQTFCVFLGTNGLIQLLHVYERIRHPHVQLTIRVLTSLNAARAMAGFLVLLFISFAFVKERRKAQCPKTKTLLST